MQISISASGSRDDVLASVAAQVAKEKARIESQHERDADTVPAKVAGVFGTLNTSVSSALDAISALVIADLGDVVVDEQCAVSVAVTIHRPDRHAEHLATVAGKK